MPYDTLRQPAPVSIIGRQPNILVVHPGSTAKTVRELIDLARAKPGAVSYGSGGVGTASHLATELLQLSTGTKMTHVPYKGLETAHTGVEEARADLVAEIAKWGKVIKASGARPE